MLTAKSTERYSQPQMKKKGTALLAGYFVSLNVWMQAHNAPLSLNPHILDEVLKYAYLPEDIVKAYRELAKKK